MIGYVLGIIGLAFFFIYFAFKLDKDHFLLQLLLVFFALYSTILIPQAVINDSCDMKVVSEDVTGENVTYGYARVCDDTVSNTKKTFMLVPLWFFRVFVTYFAIYLVWHWLMRSEKFCRKVEKMKKAFK